jgi:hypothetical protein
MRWRRRPENRGCARTDRPTLREPGLRSLSSGRLSAALSSTSRTRRSSGCPEKWCGARRRCQARPIVPRMVIRTATRSRRRTSRRTSHRSSSCGLGKRSSTPDAPSWPCQARRHSRHGGVTEEVPRVQVVQGVQVVGVLRLLDASDEVLVVLGHARLLTESDRKGVGLTHWAVRANSSIRPFSKPRAPGWPVQVMRTLRRPARPIRAQGSRADLGAGRRRRTARRRQSQ